MNNKENYPTWLVSLDIVKELKEIGFNKKTMFYFFSGNTTFKCSISEDIPLDYILPIEDIELDNYNRKGFYASIPIWEQVFEWFREKGYDSYIGLESHSYIDEGNYYYFEITKSNLYNISQLDWKGDFDDYNEAREVLVKTLIRTYKQEQPIISENE
jgi:hypothetical protein